MNDNALGDFYHGKRCLVTGDQGFIGSTLVKQLQELGAVVRGFDLNGSVSRDVCSQGQVLRAFCESRPQIVFHLAAQTEVIASYSLPHLTHQTNVQGTLNVLDACRESSTLATVEGVVVASSDKAYGTKPVRELPYRESMPLLEHGDFYAATKRSADLLAEDYGRIFDLPVRVLRSANTYGPGQRNETTLIVRAIKNILNGNRPIIHQLSAGVFREWLYIDDAVWAYLYLGKDAAERRISRNLREHCPRGLFAYNVGSGQTCYVKQVVEKILVLLGKKPDAFDIATVEGNPPQVGSQYLDSAKLLGIIPDWKPLGFDAGLQRTVEWWQTEGLGETDESEDDKDEDKEEEVLS